MSSTAQVAVLEPKGVRRVRTRSELEIAERPRLRLAAFAALGLYGALRWGTLLTPAPVWRLLGLLALAVLVAGPGRVLAGRSRGMAIALAAVAIVAVLPLCGIPVSWIAHMRLSVAARGIGEGLSALPNVLVPYNGINDWVRVVVSLGAGVLLLDAALVLCFAPPRAGDAWRAGAALPLIVLAVLPSTLSRPQLPYVHGLILFALLATFMWADRIRRYDTPLAVGVSILAGAAALVAAPRLDPHQPWLDFRALAGNLAPGHIERFDFSQHYGPLNWPRTGREVLDVKAARADYWKAEDLDVFDGRRWVLGTGAPALPAPDAAARQRWTQTIQVTLRSMQSTDLIAAGAAEQPQNLAQTPAQGADAGTWIVPAGLQPGDSYRVRTYSPQPSGPELAAAPGAVAINQLAGYRAMQMPSTRSASGQPAVIVFPAFPARAPVERVIGLYGGDGRTLIERSPYGRAYRLAQRLAGRASTSYGFIQNVIGYLRHGYTYNENPPPSALPLLSFLFGTRQGYCQQFAGAMALLLRMGGVPARVVGGFTTGAYDRASGQYLISDLDAHAWVEAWFSGYGWVRFDPTPASAPARAGTVPLPALHGKLGSAPKAAAIRHRDLTLATPQSRPVHQAAGGTPTALVIAIIVAVGLLGLTARAATLRRGPGDEAWVLELERALARSRRPAPAGLTLAALERRLGSSSPEAAAYVRAIRLGRFAGGAAAPTLAGRRALREQLRAGLGVRGRCRALWALPPLRIRPRTDSKAPGRAIK